MWGWTGINSNCVSTPTKTASRTSYPADMVGRVDPGRIAVVLKGDLNMTERDRLRLRASRVAYDLPTGGRHSWPGLRCHHRLGQNHLRKGVATGALPSWAPPGALKGSSPASAPARVHSQSTLTVALGLPIKHSLSPSAPSNSARRINGMLQPRRLGVRSRSANLRRHASELSEAPDFGPISEPPLSPVAQAGARRNAKAKGNCE